MSDCRRDNIYNIHLRNICHSKINKVRRPSITFPTYICVEYPCENKLNLNVVTANKNNQIPLRDAQSK